MLKDTIPASGGGNGTKAFPWLPDDSDTALSPGERLISYLLAFIPWLIVYQIFIRIGPSENAVITNLPFEKNLPIWEFSTIFYSLAFVYSFALPVAVKTRRQLRSFTRDIWFMTIVVGIIFTVFPFIVDQREFTPRSFLGELIYFERSIDGISGALPSGHVAWAFLIASHFSISFPRWKPVWYLFAVLISVSCVMTGAHSIPDVAAGYCTFLIVIYRQRIAGFILAKYKNLSARGLKVR